MDVQFEQLFVHAKYQLWTSYFYKRSPHNNELFSVKLIVDSLSEMTNDEASGLE